MVKASPQQVMEGVVKVVDGVIGRYRYVGFEIDPNLIERYKKEACKEVASILDIALEGFPLDVVDREKELVRECRKDSYDVLRELGIDLDWYLPTIEEKSAEIVMGKALFSVRDAPTDPQVSEELGYGLPEYSLYRNYDARSWCGRWYWSEGGSGGVCWALIHEEDVCDEVSEMINSLELRAREKGKQLLFAVWIR